MSEYSLVLMSKASQMLIEATTIQKAKELKDLALTAADWARRKGLGEDAIQHARSYALMAERRMGELIVAGQESGQVQAKGRPEKCTSEEHFSPVQIHELGITRKESSEAQALAAMPEEEFSKVVSGEKTVTEVRREQKRAEVIEKVATLPSDKYRVIYADPPWKYGDQLTEQYGATKYHYPSLSISELCAMPVKEMIDDNAVLFLWVTSPLLDECWPVIRAWGFEYKSSFVWDKVKHNMGHYNSVRHEVLLICTHGSCVPDVPQLFDSVQSIERMGKHSEKPEEFRKIIDTLYPHGKRIELFARVRVDGWEAHGNVIS